MFGGRILVVFAVFSASTVLQGCSCGWRPCLFKQKKKKAKKEAATVTEAPTEAVTEAPTEAATDSEPMAEAPHMGNGAEDIGISINNHHKLTFTVFTSRPETGTWVNRGPPIPEDDWLIDETIHFDESKTVEHGGLRKQESKGSMTLTFPSGAACKLNYEHDGDSKATANSDCGDQVVRAAVDEVNGMSVVFEVNSAPLRSMILLTDAAAEVKKVDWMLLKATWKGGGVLGLVSLLVLARRRVATPSIEPAVELGTRC